MTWLQHWSEVLFVHVPVRGEDLAGHLPKGLELDTFLGQAYIGLVFFRLKLRLLGMPLVPGVYYWLVSAKHFGDTVGPRSTVSRITIR